MTKQSRLCAGRSLPQAASFGTGIASFAVFRRIPFLPSAIMEGALPAPITHLRNQIARLEGLQQRLTGMGERPQREIDELKRQIANIEEDLARLRRGDG